MAELGANQPIRLQLSFKEVGEDVAMCLRGRMRKGGKGRTGEDIASKQALASTRRTRTQVIVHGREG